MTKQQSEKVQSCPESDSESRSVVSNSCNPMDYTPGQNTRVGSLSLLQGIFPTEGSNPSLLHCRQILYCLRYQGSPNKVYSNCGSLMFPLQPLAPSPQKRLCLLYTVIIRSKCDSVWDCKLQNTMQVDTMAIFIVALFLHCFSVMLPTLISGGHFSPL